MIPPPIGRIGLAGANIGLNELENGMNNVETAVKLHSKRGGFLDTSFGHQLMGSFSM